METKKVQSIIPLDLYNKLVAICSADKRSLNQGLHVLLQEAADKYFAKQAKLLKKSD